MMTREEPRPPASETRLMIPVAGVRRDQLVDTFSQARAQGARHHDAIDIMAPRGTPVIAAAAGRVEKLFLSKDGGNTVYVRSPDGRRIYYYAHLDHYAPALAEGVALPQGAPIGVVGSTGNADPAAPHLHFAVWMTTPERKWWEEAVALNPFPLLTAP
jgi:murein DD-endopeptidase MepM/ murein hydrolase activator NlpD